jgi:hypothetical protein
MRERVAQNAVDSGLSTTADGRNWFDLQSQAVNSVVEASIAYHSSLVEYNKAITDIQYRKGTLLEFNNVALAEGGWDPQAYILAMRRAWSRSHALDADHLLSTEPREFVTGHEEVNLLMPYEESSTLMNVEELPGAIPPNVPAPGMPLVPQPETTRPYEPPVIPPPGTKRPYEEPMTPAPGQANVESADDLGWRTRGEEYQSLENLIQQPPATQQTKRRLELPIR